MAIAAPHWRHTVTPLRSTGDPSVFLCWRKNGFTDAEPSGFSTSFTGLSPLIGIFGHTRIISHYMYWLTTVQKVRHSSGNVGSHQETIVVSWWNGNNNVIDSPLLPLKKTRMPANLILAFAFSMVRYEVFFDVKWQIAELLRKDVACSTALTEQQQKRDDCREKQGIQICIRDFLCCDFLWDTKARMWV